MANGTLINDHNRKGDFTDRLKKHLLSSFFALFTQKFTPGYLHKTKPIGQNKD